jgi:hypothetical protein
MGLASLGFASGPSMTFRIDPTSLDYKVDVFTHTDETVGGRVVQITGNAISDISMTGSIGENHGLGKAPRGEPEHPGVSWKLAEQFFNKVQSMMLHQSADTTVIGSKSTLRPATFVYSPLGLRFPCYIKSITDPDGDGQAGVVHKVARPNYRYTINLFPVLEGTTELQLAGQNANGVLDRARAAAVDAYIGRISQGIGWRFTAYNGGSTPGAPWESEFAKKNTDAVPNSTLKNRKE